MICFGAAFRSALGAPLRMAGPRRTPERAGKSKPVRTDEIERGNAVVIAGDSFAIDDAGSRAETGQCFDDQREAVCQVIARTAVEPQLRARLAGNDAEPIMLDLLQPLAARGQLVGFGWEAPRDEPGRKGTLQHVEQIKSGNDCCNWVPIATR